MSLLQSKTLLLRKGKVHSYNETLSIASGETLIMIIHRVIKIVIINFRNRTYELGISLCVATYEQTAV